MRKNDENAEVTDMERTEKPVCEQKQCVTNVYCCDECHDHHGECHHDCKGSREFRPPVCKFDIYLTRVKVIDNNWLDGQAELQIIGYANDLCGIVPGAATYMVLSKHWGWRNVMKKLGTIEIERDVSRSVMCNADAIEVDVAGGGAWEFGSGSPVTLMISCNVQSGACTTQIECRRVKLGGGVTARIEVEFMAFQVTP